MNLFLCYPKCSTCKKARDYLDSHHVSYELRDIKLNNPNVSELKEWIKKSDFSIRKFLIRVD